MQSLNSQAFVSRYRLAIKSLYRKNRLSEIKKLYLRSIQAAAASCAHTEEFCYRLIMQVARFEDVG